MSRKIHWKEGVNPHDLHITMRQSLITIDDIYKNNGQEVVVTCTGAGEHCPSSLHPYGFAYDIRTRFFDEKKKKKVYDEIKEEFDHSRYIIVSESTHFHIQLNVMEVNRWER